MTWSQSTGSVHARLTDALWDITAFRRRENRDTYLSMLEDQHGYRLNPARDSRDFDDVGRLVTSCLDRPGSLQALTALLTEFVGDSIATRRLRALVDKVDPEPLLQGDERQRIHDIVRRIDNGASLGAGTARSLYQEVVGPSYPQLGSGADGIGEIIAKLEELTVGIDGVPPLLDFVEALAARTDGRTATMLREWSDAFAGRLGVSPALRQMRQRAAHLQRGERDRTYLVIELRPDGVSPDRYLVSAWLQSGQEHGVMLRCDDDQPLPVGRLSELVAELLTEDERVVNRPTPELTVEFVLPLQLLGEPLDQLRISVDGLERRIGIDHAVVVRSLDRMRRPAYRHSWRSKWDWLQKNPHQVTVCWVTQSGQYRSESLYNMLLSDKRSVCMAMTFPPLVHAGKPDELRIALQAGAPIVAWCRKGREPDRFTDEFQGLFERGPLELPDTVLALRRNALRALDSDAAADHLGFELTLLFDDADRLPQPYVQLNAPA